MVFPEGGRSEDGSLGPFKPGGPYIAIKAGVPVVPLGIPGTDRVHRLGSPLILPGTVELHIGTPIPTDQLSPDHTHLLLVELRERIRALVETGR